MNKKINILTIIISICTMSIILNAQEVTGIIVASAENVVKGAPYSADALSETIQTLADGNKITRVFKRKLYRDGEGRTRTEELSSNTVSAEYLSLRETITISDPVVGFNYYLNPVCQNCPTFDNYAKNRFFKFN